MSATLDDPTEARLATEAPAAGRRLEIDAATEMTFTLHVEFDAYGVDEARYWASETVEALALLRPEVHAYTARVGEPEGTDVHAVYCGAAGPLPGSVCTHPVHDPDEAHEDAMPLRWRDGMPLLTALNRSVDAWITRSRHTDHRPLRYTATDASCLDRDGHDACAAASTAQSVAP